MSQRLAILLLLTNLAAVGLGAQTAALPTQESTPAPLTIKPYPIQSPERQKLTAQYAQQHYGIDDWRLVDPKLVIVHYTGTDSDDVSLSVFKPAKLGNSRPDIIAAGPLNVGVHFVITKNGTVWSLLPETAMGRHAVGFNHVALGIEMTGSGPGKLTPAQLQACAALVADLSKRIPSLRYLCGHHEYTQTDRAHYGLFRELAPAFPTPVKVDPGPKFMADLRSLLATKFSLVLGD